MTPENSATKTAEKVTQTSREQASEVTSTAKDEARDVMQQAGQQVRSTARHVQDDVRERMNSEASKLAQTLHATGQQMRAMAAANEDESSVVASVVRESAQAADRVAARLEDGGVDALFAQVRTWARQNPGGFLLGAAVSGFAAGRLARNLTGESENGGSSSRALQ